MGLFSTKSIKTLTQGTGHHSLKKTLGSLDMMLLGMGCIIGTGIFVLTGVAAANYAGPGIMLSFVLAGFAAACAALAYSELAAMIPIAGSSYSYAYAALGEIVAFVSGWLLISIYTVGSAVVAAGWSGYIVGLFKTLGVILPQAWTTVPADGGIVNAPAIFIVLLLTIFLTVGTKESTILNKILVFIKVAMVILFLVLAGPHVDSANWSPFLPFGLNGVAAGAAMVFFAYNGFDAVSSAAEECKNPNKGIPIGIIGSLILCTVLYVAVAAVLTGVVPYTLLNNSEPVAFALRYIGSNAGSALVAVGAVCGITTVLLVNIFAMSRAYLAMSRDGMLPSFLVKIHPKYGTPYTTIAFTGVVVSLLAGFLPISTIAEIVNISALSNFCIVSVCVLALRKTQPDALRPFRCPAVNIIAPLGVILCGYLITSLSRESFIYFGIWLIFGMGVYFSYSRHNMPLHNSNDNTQDILPK